MRKVFSVIIASLMLSATPLMATESTGTLPKALTDMGITSQDFNDVSQGVSDSPTSSEVSMLRRRRGNRDCPRGYRLEAYRIRIGRFVIVRYICVRMGHGGDHRRPYNLDQSTTQESEMDQNVE